jgi:hypothetical protein
MHLHEVPGGTADDYMVSSVNLFHVFGIRAGTFVRPTVLLKGESALRGLDGINITMRLREHRAT